MMTSRPDLVELAEAVADGSQVDWAQAEASASTHQERLAIQQLRSLAEMGAASRSRPTRWGTLHIQGEVGSGAFGTVYRAWDPRLEREVALKLLHGGAGQASASAVIKEGRLLAQIRHPNVVTVFGADEHDDCVGIWMEYVNGRTLRAIVSEQGPFGAAEAGLIGRDLCGALAAVHRQGFVHRDVKAQNVMRETGGRTVLMDFGAGEAVTRTTDDGPLRGTPAYLAPEILDGQPPSVRSDVYSLGVLLYFLVSGAFPVPGTSIADFREPEASRRRRLLRDVRPDLPSDFVRIVDACIAPRPEDRPQSAGAVEALLEGALGLRGEDMPARESPARRPSKPSGWSTRGRAAALALLILGSVGTAGVVYLTTRGAPATTIRRDSVAILPISNLTGTPDDDYFSEGITADLIANLSALRDLRVIAGSSTRKYADRRKSPSEIGAELGVATVLDASLRRSGDRVRIVAQLIDARTGEQLWSDSFDRQLADIVAMKSDVSNRIAVALRGELSQRDMELLRPGRQYDYTAFNLYMKGRHYWSLRTDDAVNRSIQYFHDALAHDPSFAPAYAGLADAYTSLGVYGSIPREEAYARAAAAAAKAVELDDSLAEAHASLAQARKNRFEWQAAEQSFKRAIELKPGSVPAHLWYSLFLTQHGRFAEATAEIRIAMSLDPLSAAPRLQFASLLTMARRYDDAIAQYEQALAMDSGFATAYRHMAKAYVHKGEYERALALFDEARRKSAAGAEDQELKADLGYLYAVSGRQADARRMAADLIQRYQKANEAVAGSIAAIYAGLRSADDAMAWLTKAGETKDPETGYLLVDPRWDNLRDDARFRALLTKLGFNSQIGATDGRR